jgi:F0F1-type ATP synthase assembly protein I
VSPSRPLIRYARGGAIAFEFTGTIAAGAFVGWWIDDRYGTTPWAMTGLTVVAVVGGFIRLIQMLRRFEQIDRGAKR